MQTNLGSVVARMSNGNEQSGRIRVVFRLFHAFTEAKTFSVVITVLVISCFLPVVIGIVLHNYCTDSCQQIWYAVAQYEFYGMNSIVNAFIYEMRHINYRKALQKILFKISYGNCCS